MFEKYMICTRDFRNVVENGQATGFQLKIRINYYRGCYLSMIDTLRLVVDGEEFSADKLSFTCGNRTYSIPELGQATNDRWGFGEPAILTVGKPGGLTSGVHTVQLGMFIRTSYMPRFDPDGLYRFFPGPPAGPKGETHWGEPPSPLPLTATKKMTLVQ